MTFRVSARSDHLAVPGKRTPRFVVRILTVSGLFATSEARVELNLDGQLYVFRPTGPDASTLERYWHVFDLVKPAAPIR